MSTLGVIVFSLHGIKHLAPCLESVRWADAVTVLHLDDHGKVVSADEVKRPSKGNRTDWVLHLWGEEHVEEELRGELCAFAKREMPKALSYRIQIRSLLLGRWVEGSLWGPSPALRLSREVREPVPGWWQERQGNLREASGLLRGWIGDYSLAKLSDGVDRVNDLSELWAKQLRTKGLTPSPVAMVIFAPRVFLRLLFMNGVFSNGLAGLTLSTLAAYATLLTGAKLWEGNRQGKKDHG